MILYRKGFSKQRRLAMFYKNPNICLYKKIFTRIVCDYFIAKTVPASFWASSSEFVKIFEIYMPATKRVFFFSIKTIQIHSMYYLCSVAVYIHYKYINKKEHFVCCYWTIYFPKVTCQISF